MIKFKSLHNKMLRTILVGLSMTAVASTTASGASISAKSLAGLKRLSIVIEDLDDNAKKCGIAEASLKTSLQFILGQSNIKIVEDPKKQQGFIYLNVIVLRNCATSYQLKINTSVSILMTNNYSVGTIWSTGGLRTGGDAAADLTDSVEEMAKTLVNDWNSVNN